MFEKLKKIIKEDWEGYSSFDKKMMFVMGVLGVILILGAVKINMLPEPLGYGYDIDIDDENLDKDINDEENELSSEADENIAQNEEKTPEEIKREKIRKIRRWEIRVESKKPGRIIQKPMINPTSSEIFTELKPLPIEKSLEGVEINLKNSDRACSKTTELTEEIIDRLKNYECYKLTGDGNISKVYKSFEDMYEKERDNCEGYTEWFHPARIGEYKYGEAAWLSSPKLIYRTPQSHISVRGVLKIKYLRANNRYNLEPDKWYERDVEYWFKNTTNGRFLTKIIYFSNWKEVE